MDVKNFEVNRGSASAFQYLFLFVIRVLPVRQVVGGEETPAAMPRPQPRHIIKHGEEASVLCVHLQRGCDLHPDRTLHRGCVWHLQH